MRNIADRPESTTLAACTRAVQQGGATTSARTCNHLSTVVHATMWWLMALALGAAIGCGGKSKGSAKYLEAIDRQEACCRQLEDQSAQEACIGRIVRVEDPEVQASEINRATYACFVRHFVCDPMTGAVSKEASQKQYDCIDELDG